MIILILALGFAVTFPACDKNEDTQNTDCDVFAQSKMKLDFTKGAEDTLNGHMYYEQLGNYKVRISFYNSITGVCTYEHITLSAIIDIRDHPCELQARIGLCPGIPDDVLDLKETDLSGLIHYEGT